MDVADKMGEFTPVTKFFASKGAVFKGQKIEAQIIVGTPGTVIDVENFLQSMSLVSRIGVDTWRWLDVAV
jgi:hypothetical protein